MAAATQIKPAAPILKRRVQNFYVRLLTAYGPQGWWPLLSVTGSNPTKTGSHDGYHPGDYSYPKTADQRFEICVGAILAQNTAWPNAEKALFALQKAGLLDARKMACAGEKTLAKRIRPAGYFNQKAKKLTLFSEFFLNLDGKIPTRKALLALWGVGPETADSILLYAFGKPEFVVDAYTRRIGSGLGWFAPDASYDHIKTIFQNALKPDYRFFQEYHALLVEHAKRTAKIKTSRPENRLAQ